MATRTRTTAPVPFQVGDKVEFTLVNKSIKAVIVEDRGAIGVGGRRVYRIRFNLDPEETRYAELPAEDLHAAG
ncbi:MAG TPA: hypothetical protein VGG61_16755 [Gemmataceae bacterium]|jgi:hypothetical protein